MFEGVYDMCVLVMCLPYKAMHWWHLCAGVITELIFSKECVLTNLIAERAEGGKDRWWYQNFSRKHR